MQTDGQNQKLDEIRAIDSHGHTLEVHFHAERYDESENDFICLHDASCFFVSMVLERIMVESTPFDDLGLAVSSDEPLDRHTWLSVGGVARYFCEPVDEVALSKLVVRCHDVNIQLRVLGGGSNVLVPRAGFSGMVVRLSSPSFSAIEISQTSIKAGAGAKLVHVVSAAVQAGLSGIETLVGIPGTIGGSLIGNAGGQAGDIGERVSEVTLMNTRGTIDTRGRSDLAFQYRQSNLEDSIVLGCRLELDQENNIVLTKRMQKQWIVERSRQPSGTRTVGMMFKDPHGTSAESLIEQAGARDMYVGKASISGAHANYVVAGSQCSSDDIRSLLDEVRLVVRERLGIDLEPQLEVW